jgi:hypothetical protein
MMIDIIEKPLQESPGNDHTHLTTLIRFVEADGGTSAYRRWGKISSGQPPLSFVPHFRGGMDH